MIEHKVIKKIKKIKLREITMNESKIFRQEEIESDEDKIARLLSLLPKELHDLWAKKVEGMDEEDALEIIEKVIRERASVKEKIFTKIHEIRDPELQEEVRSVVRAVESTFGDTNYFVGNGSVAEVYEMPYAPQVCVKYLIDVEMAREHGNNFQEEVAYLEDMKGFSVEGIRVPYVYFYHMSDFGTCFGMEKIEGKSLNIIMENPEKIEFLDVIKKQDMSEVIDRMNKFIKKMHEEKRIVHRDLTARNIMVDKNGNWYVIDFGKAKRIEIGDDSTEGSERTDASTAENSIRELYAKIA